MSSTEAHVLRKRMLLMRAAQERQELAGNVEDLREATQISNLLKAIVPAVAIKTGFPLVMSLLRRSPLLGSAIGFLLRRFTRQSTTAVKQKSAGWSGRIAKVIGLIAMAWQGFRAVRAFKKLEAPIKKRWRRR